MPEAWLQVMDYQPVDIVYANGYNEGWKTAAAEYDKVKDRIWKDGWKNGYAKERSDNTRLYHIAITVTLLQPIVFLLGLAVAGR